MTNGHEEKKKNKSTAHPVRDTRGLKSEKEGESSKQSSKNESSKQSSSKESSKKESSKKESSKKESKNDNESSKNDVDSKRSLNEKLEEASLHVTANNANGNTTTNNNNTTNNRAPAVRFFRNKLPKVGELVIGKTTRITDLGVYIKLLEYANIEGLIVIGELSKKRIKNVQKMIKLNRIEVCSVLRVDEEKGYVDLSRKKVNAADYQGVYRLYCQNKVGHNIMVSVGQKSGEDVGGLYGGFGWGKGEEWGGLYRYFGLLMDALNGERGSTCDKRSEERDDTRSSTTHDSTRDTTTHGTRGNTHSTHGNSTHGTHDKLKSLFSNIPDRIIPILIEQTKLKYNVQKIKIRADIDLTCPSSGGVMSIKEALRVCNVRDERDVHGNDSTPGNTPENVVAPADFLITLIRPPTYSLTLNTTDKEKGTRLLKAICNRIKARIVALNGTYTEVSFKVFGAKKDLGEIESDELGG